ncbi:MAG: hypothetical protein CM1200mP31_3080 [Candidatus Neomarinimicrobiota bacterium]|nr:MAG: hypothetical protein CM1200mP31_3080 [Candidatus Neomarinimicrobiota bacterium]
MNHDSNYYAAYLLLFEIADKNNSSSKKIVFEELKRLNPSLNIEYKAPKSNRKKITKNKKQNNSILTIPYIKLLVQQGKILQAKKSLKIILDTTKKKKQINEAKNILNGLDKKKKNEDQYFINRQNKLRELLAKNHLDGMLLLTYSYKIFMWFYRFCWSLVLTLIVVIFLLMGVILFNQKMKKKEQKQLLVGSSPQCNQKK